MHHLIIGFSYQLLVNADIGNCAYSSTINKIKSSSDNVQMFLSSVSILLYCTIILYYTVIIYLHIMNIDQIRLDYYSSIYIYEYEYIT